MCPHKGIMSEEFQKEFTTWLVEKRKVTTRTATSYCSSVSAFMTHALENSNGQETLDKVKDKASGLAFHVTYDGMIEEYLNNLQSGKTSCAAWRQFTEYVGGSSNRKGVMSKEFRREFLNFMRVTRKLKPSTAYNYSSYADRTMSLVSKNHGASEWVEDKASGQAFERKWGKAMEEHSANGRREKKEADAGWGHFKDYVNGGESMRRLWTGSGGGATVNGGGRQDSSDEEEDEGIISISSDSEDDWIISSDSGGDKVEEEEEEVDEAASKLRVVEDHMHGNDNEEETAARKLRVRVFLASGGGAGEATARPSQVLSRADAHGDVVRSNIPLVDEQS